MRCKIIFKKRFSPYIFHFSKTNELWRKTPYDGLMTFYSILDWKIRFQNARWSRKGSNSFSRLSILYSSLTRTMSEFNNFFIFSFLPNTGWKQTTIQRPIFHESKFFKFDNLCNSELFFFFQANLLTYMMIDTSQTLQRFSRLTTEGKFIVMKLKVVAPIWNSLT